MSKLIVMANGQNNGEFDDDVVLIEQTVTEFAHPSLYAIIMHNDDFTTMEFVVMVLMDVLGLDAETAYLLMLAIHKTGRAKVAVLPKEIAEMKVATIDRLAAEHEYPLLTTLERMD